MDIENKLKKMFIEGLKLEEVSPKDINEDTVLFGEGLELDSLDATEIVFLIEENFEIKFSLGEETQEAFKNFGSLKAYLEKKIQ